MDETNNNGSHASDSQKRPMSSERKEKFLEHLRVHGFVTAAAKHASPHCRSLGCSSSFYRVRKTDPDFASDWDGALAEADDLVLKEMKRRGVSGWKEPVFGSKGKGEGTGKVGSKRVYSDKMLELYARIKSATAQQALNKSRVEVVATVVNKTVDLGIGELSPESQELLRQILEKEANNSAGADGIKE